jgi:predicted acylesterase/phospholipase RssA
LVPAQTKIAPGVSPLWCLVGAILRVGMRFSVSSVVLVAVLALVAITAARLYLGPFQTSGPIGSCLKGGIDLNDPVPFTRAHFSGTIVGLAASGGGSRAAYLEAAILREIRRAGPALRIGPPPHSGKSLLDQISTISSVSGGSFAATYFSLKVANLREADADSEAWTSFLEKMAIEYRKRQWYGQAAWNPVHWARSIFTDYNRGVLARDDYGAVLFGTASLQDLPDRPALYINAFDVANHVRFVLSKNYIDTTYFQPSNWWGKLSAPQTLLSANDLSFARIDPASISLADAVFASSSFPIAYPNLPIRHCGSKILFQGGQIFLADGALADNSGLITLMTQLRAGLDTRTTGSTIVAIYIDASVDRIDTNGTKYQQMGIEERYAWSDTIVGHANESILGAIALLQDLGWKLIEGSGVVTDQLNVNWPRDLTGRSGGCGPAVRASWRNPFESGALAMRPLVIRLGLRDVINPDFASTYGAYLKARSRQFDLPKSDEAPTNIARLPKNLGRRLQSIPTDFALAADDRKLLDLVASLLVHGKLAGDIARWNEVRRSVTARPAPPIKCPM